jgi:hypothetical protein
MSAPFSHCILGKLAATAGAAFSTAGLIFSVANADPHPHPHPGMTRPLSACAYRLSAVQASRSGEVVAARERGRAHPPIFTQRRTD